MMYINNLDDMNQKSAEAASIPILRELKKTLTLPLDEEKMDMLITQVIASDTDKESISNSIALIDEMIAELSGLLENKEEDKEVPKIYEAMNVKRGIEMLSSLKPDLEKNLFFANEVERKKIGLMREFIYAINTLYQEKNPKNPQELNDMLNRAFKIVTRSEDMTFNTDKIIGEGEMKTMTSFHQSVPKGFFFHFTLDEELKKYGFEGIQGRIPPSELERNKKFTANLYLIKDGVERAYDHNVRMMTLALNMYALLKWAQSK